MTGRLILGAGAVLLAALFLMRGLVPVVDLTLLVIFLVLAGAAVATIGGSRVGAGVLMLLSLALFQPITAREFAFNLSSIDQPYWRWWAVASVVSLGLTIILAALTLIGVDLAADRRKVALAFVAGAALGVGLLPVFGALAPQPGFGRDLDDAEIASLPVIELLNYRYEPPIVSVSSDEVYRAKLLNPSDLPHTVTIDALDLEVFVPAERWSVIEIDGGAMASLALELYCSVGDHRAQGMQAILEVG